MSFNVRDFAERAKAYNNFASPNKFRVQMFPKWATNPDDQEILKDLSFFAYNTTLPGVTLDTERVRIAGYGPLEQRPRSVINDPVQMNFYVDDSGFLLDMFHNWMNRIVYYNDPSLRMENRGQYSYDVAYAKGSGSYLCNISIIMYKQEQPSAQPIQAEGITRPLTTDEFSAGSLKGVVQCILYDAFPIIVGDTQLAWENTDDLVRLPVAFAYRTHRIHKLSGRFSTIDDLFASSLTPSALPPEVGNVIDTVGDYGRPGSVNGGRRNALFESLASSAKARVRDILIPARVDNAIRNVQAARAIF